jgi:hypothetical protein
MNDRNTISYKWVTGTYYGERAKKVIQHAEGGITYKIFSSAGKGQSLTVTAASKWVPADKPMPPHIRPIRDEEVIQSLERWSKPWLRREQPKPKPIEDEGLKAAASMFPKRKGNVPGWDELYGGK